MLLRSSSALESNLPSKSGKISILIELNTVVDEKKRIHTGFNSCGFPPSRRHYKLSCSATTVPNQGRPVLRVVDVKNPFPFCENVSVASPKATCEKSGEEKMSLSNHRGLCDETATLFNGTCCSFYNIHICRIINNLNLVNCAVSGSEPQFPAKLVS